MTYKVVGNLSEAALELATEITSFLFSFTPSSFDIFVS